MFRILLTFSTVLCLVKEDSDTSLCPELRGTCDCERKNEKIGIICHRLDGMDSLMDTVRGSFQNETINDIKIFFSRIPYLEARVFQELDLRQFMVISSTVGNISEVAFEEAQMLYSVIFVNLFNYAEIPEAMRSANLNVFRMLFGNLTSVGQQLQNMTSLAELMLYSNRIGSVHPDAFLRCEELRIINLANNRIKSLDEGVFRNSKRIVTLILSNNQLLSLDRVIYPSTYNIKELFLENNTVSNIDRLFVFKIPHLVHLYLDGNPLRTLDYRSFGNRYYKVTVMSLVNTSLSTIGEGTFDGLIRLGTLILSRNNLAGLPDDVFKNVPVLYLYLDENMLARIDNILKGTNFKKLDFSSNRIQNVDGAFSTQTKLLELYLNNNLIETITNGTFASCIKLKILALRNNKIKYLQPDSFAGLDQELTILKLSFNDIEDLGGAFNVQPALEQLKQLELNNNQLRSISNSDLNLPGLVTLDLQYNTIEYLRGAFARLFKLVNLNLLSNRLVTFTKDNVAGNMLLENLILYGNPLSCDCRILWLVESMESPIHLRVDNESRCYAPEWMRNVSVHTLTPSDVTVWEDGCPDQCELCQCKPNGTEVTVSVSCSNRNLTSLPRRYPNNTVELDVSQNRLTNLSEDLSKLIPQLRYLNISGNQLDNLVNKFPLELTTLDVSENRIRRFPSQGLGELNLKICKLSGNPWTCDCEANSFRNWMVKYFRTVLDINETRCSNSSSSLKGKVLARLTEMELCPEEIALYAIISIAVLAVLLGMSGAAIGYIRYQMPIKVWLYTRGLCLRWVKEEDLDEDKDFDAFVAFSSQDQACVDQLLEQLEEREPHFRLCVHYRDFAAGELIVENISWAVASSKKTLVLLSKDFLESEWTMQEFREAHTLALTEKLNRIILVLVGVTPPNEDLPAEIRAHVQVATYIKWEDRFFWEKLRYAMPKRAIGHRHLWNDDREIAPMLGNR